MAPVQEDARCCLRRTILVAQEDARWCLRRRILVGAAQEILVGSA